MASEIHPGSSMPKSNADAEPLSHFKVIVAKITLP